MITIHMTEEEIKEACVLWANEVYEMNNKDFNVCRLAHEGTIKAEVTMSKECKHPNATFSHGGSSMDWECPDCGLKRC
jgi:hypothetical protein